MGDKRLCVTASCKVTLEVFYPQPWDPQEQVQAIIDRARQDAVHHVVEAIQSARPMGAAVRLLREPDDSDVVIRVSVEDR